MAVGHSPIWVKSNSLRLTTSTNPRLLIWAESGSFENTDQNRNVRVQINGSEVLNASAPRSYRITQLRNTNGTWSLIASNGYDVYGTVGAPESALAFINGFSNGDLMILNTWDEPFTNRTVLAPTLRDSFGSRIYTWQSTWDFRDMHLLIAVKGRGVIFEEFRTRYSNSIHFSGWLA